MPHPIQIGGVTDRLRSYFRLRGRSSFALDETVVPTVNVQDMDSPLYRRQDVGFLTGCQGGQAVGVISLYGIALGSVGGGGLTEIPDPTAPGKAVVTHVTITSLAQTGVLISYLDVGTLLSNQTTVAQTHAALNTDDPLPVPPITPGLFEQIGVVSQSGRPAGAFVGIVNTMYRLRLLAHTPIVLPLNAVVRGHTALLVAPDTANVGLVVSFAGVWNPIVE